MSATELLPERGTAAHPDDEVFARRVFVLVNGVQTWANERADRVSVCYLVYNPDGFDLTVVGKSAPYDYALNDELAAFAVEAVRKGFPLSAVLYGPGTSLTPSGPGRSVIQVRPG